MFRKLVTGTRRRYVDKDFNIDLTYICPNRIIVMSYPGSGALQTQIRNDCRDVKRFLDEKHPEKYHVFNVSESPYEKERFDGRVTDFNWHDHQAPPFTFLPELVHQMSQCLTSDPENVVVIHCNSGKGRAGLSCISLLLYIGFFDNVLDTAKYFSSLRFTDGKGISQPCQVRFLYYYQAFLQRVVISPQVKYLRKLVLSQVPITSTIYNGCNKPFFEIYQVMGLVHKKIFENIDSEQQVRFYGEDEGKIELKLPGKLQLHGNILIKFKYHGTFQTSDLFRISFNTAFIGSSNILDLSRWEISPESCQKDQEKFNDKFSCVLFFENYCRNGCKSHITPIDKICQNCTQIMGPEIDNWQEASNNILKRPSFDTESTRSFLNGELETIKAAENHKIKWQDRQQCYQITKEMFQKPDWSKSSKWVKSEQSMSMQSIQWINKSVNVMKQRSDSVDDSASDLSQNSRLKKMSHVTSQNQNQSQSFGSRKQTTKTSKSLKLNGIWSSPRKKEGFQFDKSSLLRIVNENEEEKVAYYNEFESKKINNFNNDGTKTTQGFDDSMLKIINSKGNNNHRGSKNSKTSKSSSEPKFQKLPFRNENDEKKQIISTKNIKRSDNKLIKEEPDGDDGNEKVLAFVSPYLEDSNQTDSFNFMDSLHVRRKRIKELNRPTSMDVNADGDFDQIMNDSSFKKPSKTPKCKQSMIQPCFEIKFLDDQPEIALEKHQEQLLQQDLKILSASKQKESQPQTVESYFE